MAGYLAGENMSLAMLGFNHLQWFATMATPVLRIAFAGGGLLTMTRCCREMGGDVDCYCHLHHHWPSFRDSAYWGW